MNRRKALLGLIGLSGLTAAVYSGFTWRALNKKPDLAFLDLSKPLMKSLVEAIFPNMGTPGAGELDVHEFVIMMVKEASGVKAQNKFVTGLTKLQEYTQSQFGRPFTTCSKAEQVQTLRHLEEDAKLLPGIVGKAQNKFLGKSFFATLKEYTAIGYFSSLPGSTQVLRYNPIPGHYASCEKITQDEKAWATN